MKNTKKKNEMRTHSTNKSIWKCLVVVCCLSEGGGTAVGLIACTGLMYVAGIFSGVKATQGATDLFHDLETWHALFQPFHLPFVCFFSSFFVFFFRYASRVRCVQKCLYVDLFMGVSVYLYACETTKRGFPCKHWKNFSKCLINNIWEAKLRLLKIHANPLAIQFAKHFSRILFPAFIFQAEEMLRSFYLILQKKMLSEPKTNTFIKGTPFKTSGFMWIEMPLFEFHGKLSDIIINVIILFNHHIFIYI